MYRPFAIIVPDTAFGIGTAEAGNTAQRGNSYWLVNELEKAFDLECQPMARSYWNEDAGLLSSIPRPVSQLKHNQGKEYISNLAEGSHRAATLMSASDK